MQFQKLREVLSAAQRRAQRKEQTVVVLGALALLLASVSLLAPLSLLTGSVLVAWVLRLVLVATLVAAALALRRKLPRSLFVSTRIADVIGLQTEGQRSAVATASELVQWQAQSRQAQAKQAVGARVRPQPSLSLVEAHVEATQAALDPKRTQERVDEAYADFEKRGRLALAFAGIALMVSVAMVPSQHRSLLRAFFSASEAEISDLPLVGNLSLTLRFPAYTELGPREVKGGDGTIRAIKGTTVLIRATAEKQAQSASITLGEGDAARVIPLAIEGRDLVGEITLEKNDRYRFSVKPLFGTELKERRGHAIFVDEDKYPSIDIREPAQDLELKDTGRLTIQYSADDDFAVTELALNYKVNAGVMQRVVLPSPAAKVRIRHDYAFDLSTLQLRPGDVVTIELEAKDNDTISGPKKSTSRQRRITAFSSEQHRRELLARFRALVDKMVDQLADELENPLNLSADVTRYTQKALPIDDRAMALVTELQEVAKGLKEAEGSEPKFNVAAERSAQELRQAYTAKKQSDTALQKASQQVTLAITRQVDVVQLLERTVVYFEDLRALAAIDEMKAQAKELAATSQQLKDLLKQFKETGDEAMKAALEAEIGELKKRIGEMMQKMAELRKGLPQDFVNREAMQRRAMDNIFDKVDQLLAENKLDELAGELDRLDNQIKNLENSMNDAEKEYGGERYSELKKDLQEFAQNLDAVEAAQKDVMEKSREAEQAYRQAAQQKLGQNLDDMVKQSIKDLEDAERALQKINERDPRMASLLEHAHSRANDTRTALEQRDFLEAREMAKHAVQDSHDLSEQVKNYGRIDQMNGQMNGTKQQEAQKSAAEAQAKIAEVSKRLDKLFPDPKDVLSPKQMQALDDLRKRQQEIAGRTQKLGQQMKDINKKGPMFDQNAQADMESAKGSMERAGQELGQKQAGKAVSSQGAALEQMRKMKEAMKKQGQGQGSGMPMPIGGMPNPFGDGNDPRNQDKVEIPNGDQFKVPPEFRRDILDAMKQGTPQRFKQQVDEFYKELIK